MDSRGEETEWAEGFRDRLSHAMVKRGVKQRHLAKMVGVEESHVSRWASGAVPRPYMVVKIAQSLAISTDYLLGVSQPNTTLASVTPHGKAIADKATAAMLAHRTKTSGAAAALGVSSHQLMGWLAGEEPFPVDRLAALAAYLNLHPSELMDTDETAEDAAKMAKALSRKLERLGLGGSK